MLLDSKPCHPATFSYTNPRAISDKTATKCYIPMLQTSNLAVLLIFPALSVSGIHEVLGIKCKGGRARDP